MLRSSQYQAPITGLEVVICDRPLDRRLVGDRLAEVQDDRHPHAVGLPVPLEDLGRRTSRLGVSVRNVLVVVTVPPPLRTRWPSPCRPARRPAPTGCARPCRPG